ncbi:MAG: isoprenyl transferase [Clostridiales bacterium]|nr:isoprenyl transferase [Clostridiales bacterium]
MRFFAKARRAQKTEAPAYDELLARIDKERLPRHIAVIMDGNGRWAKERGLPRYAGHSHGTEALRLVVEQARELGVRILTVFAFSTENWKRPSIEVSALMELLRKYIAGETARLHAQHIRLNFIGDWRELERGLCLQIEEAMKVTAANREMTLNIAVNYGGRQEILRSVRKIAEKAALGQISPAEIDEQMLESGLDTAGMPDPDLLIRSAGELRISNFLLWQLAYAELYYTPVYWPVFDKTQFLLAVLDYQKRGRRFGGLGE